MKSFRISLQCENLTPYLYIIERDQFIYNIEGSISFSKNAKQIDEEIDKVEVQCKRS